MKEAFDLIRKKDVLDIIHSHSCNTARIEEGVLNLPVISVFARNDKIKERINDVIERISCGAEKFDYDRGSVDAYRNALSIVSEVEAEFGNDINVRGNEKTNADRIRSMSDEELAEWFNQHDCVCDFCTFNMGCLQQETVRCKEGFLNWLKSPTTD